MVTIFERIINAEVLFVNSLQNESELHVNNVTSKEMGPYKVHISLFGALGTFGINVKQVIKQCHDLKYKVPF